MVALSVAPSTLPADGRTGGRLSRGTMIAWGIGTLGPVTVLTATNALLLRFLTDIYGIGAAVAASLIATSKLYDVFADVGCGVVSDRTRSRWGRRRPYLIGGAVLLAVSIVALFAAPTFASTSSRVIYMGAMLVFYATAYSVFNIPYMAMPGEMARDYDERTALMSWRVYAVGASIIIATYCGPLLLDRFGGKGPAYVAMAWVFAPFVVGAGVVAFLGTSRAPATAREALPLKLLPQIGSVLTNKPFVSLIVVKFVTLMSLGLQAIYPFFFQRILGGSFKLLGTYFLCQSLMFIVAPPAWGWLSRRLGKKPTFLIALAVSLPGWASWWWAGTGEATWAVLGRALLIGASGAGVILMGQSMLPDTMQYDHQRTGLRREGIFAALYTTVEKLSGALGVAIVGALLGAAGYVQSRGATVAQPASALLAIRFIMAWIPFIITAVGMLALIPYDLTAEKLARGARMEEPPAVPQAPAPAP